MIGKRVLSKKQIHVTSKNEMDREMKRIQDLFKKKEGEDTWEQFDQALKNIKVWATVDMIYQYPGFVDHIKLLKQPIISSLTSERTRLSGTASDLLQALSQAMQRKYEIIHELFMPTLIQLFSRSNKVHVRNTLTCFKAIVENSKVPRTTHRLCMLLKQKSNDHSGNISKATRYHVTECLNTVIQVNATNDLLHYVDDIEAAIMNTAMDPAPEVRSSIRMCYKYYCEKVPERATKFTETMTPDVLRYLLVTANRGSVSKSTIRSRSTIPIRSASSPAKPVPSRRVVPSTSKSSVTSRPATKLSTTSYLSPTTSSTAKTITSNDSSLTTATEKKGRVNLPSKYIGSNGTTLKMDPGFQLRAPRLIRGKPVLRQKVESPKKEPEEHTPDDGLKRSLSSQSDTNQKKAKLL